MHIPSFSQTAHFSSFKLMVVGYTGETTDCILFRKYVIAGVSIWQWKKDKKNGY
jgi:hypothetical protein